jgi:hypothetical protein
MKDIIQMVAISLATICLSSTIATAGAENAKILKHYNDKIGTYRRIPNYHTNSVSPKPRLGELSADLLQRHEDPGARQQPLWPPEPHEVEPHPHHPLHLHSACGVELDRPCTHPPPPKAAVGPKQPAPGAAAATVDMVVTGTERR